MYENIKDCHLQSCSKMSHSHFQLNDLLPSFNCHVKYRGLSVCKRDKAMSGNLLPAPSPTPNYQDLTNLNDIICDTLASSEERREIP